MLSSFRPSFIGIPFHKPYKNPPLPHSTMHQHGTTLSISLPHILAHTRAKKHQPIARANGADVVNTPRAAESLPSDYDCRDAFLGELSCMEPVKNGLICMLGTWISDVQALTEVKFSRFGCMGLVTNEFLQLQTLKASCGRDFVVRTVILYWTAAKHLFTQMSSQLDMNDAVDFYDILSCADDLFERSKSIGAVHVSIACANIFNGCQENNKDRCTQGLVMAKREFARLQVKFESIVEFERMIIECEDMLERESQEGAN